MIAFTEDQATALVTDAGTLKRGRELASPTKWGNLGCTDTAAWGECAGSGSKPYLVGIDLTEPAFKCSCPSRVFPCKHGAGLLLLLARQPTLLAAGTPPAWLAEWLQKRQAKGEEQAAKTATKSVQAPATEVGDDQPVAAPVAGPTAAQLKREAQRHARMQAGAEELETWLLDLLRAGLATLEKKPSSLWESQAARLVDNQLPGFAAILRELADYPTAGPHWAARLLSRLGELYVLLRAFLNRQNLAPAAQQDVWQQAGITPKKEALLTDATTFIVADTWVVLGQYTWPEERVLGRRSWLYGQQSGRTALVVEFAFGSQAFATALVPQGKYAGELAFYPGLLPLRATPVSLVFQGSAAEAIPPGQGISQLVENYATALAHQPWLRQWPAALGPVFLLPQPEGQWTVLQAGEALALPLRLVDEDVAWQWLALGGGQPQTLFGEWDGQVFTPLVSWTEDRNAAGAIIITDNFFEASEGARRPIGEVQVGALPTAAELAATPVAEPSATEAPAWPPLLRLALLGTRQSAEVLPPFPTLPATGSREQQLLLAAGTWALVRKAGYLPPTGAAAPLPAPADSLPALGPLGAECLHRMLVNDLHLELLPDYLHRVAAVGRRVPELLLVPLLQYATRSVAVRADLSAVLGARGRWLAALSPAWVKLAATADLLADPTDLSIWETGSLPERLAWLRQRLVQDADAARALLLAALPTEPAKVQEELLQLLAEHLHADAEPTLTALLKSRGQEVRRQAAALLVCLPGAALTERLWARAAPLLTAKRKLLGLGSATLEVTLPTEWDKSWLADGIEENTNEYRYALPGKAATALGPAAARLGSLLALLPPQRWTAHLGLTADELLAAALASEWAVPLLPAWAKSALLHRHAELAAAFLQLWVRQRPALQAAHCSQLIDWVSLAKLLPAATRQTLLLDPILRRVQRQDPDWDADLGYVPAPWPQHFSRAVLATISSLLANTAVPDQYHNVPLSVRQHGWLLPQTVAPNLALADIPWAIQLVEAIPQPHELLQSPIQTFVEQLRFMAELEASLHE